MNSETFVPNQTPCNQRRRLQLMSIKILPMFNQMLLAIVVCITAVLLRRVWSVKNYPENSRRCWLIQVCEKDAFVVVWSDVVDIDSNIMCVVIPIYVALGYNVWYQVVYLSLSITIHHSHIFPSHKSFVSLSLSPTSLLLYRTFKCHNMDATRPIVQGHRSRNICQPCLTSVLWTFELCKLYQDC